jgi:hypothetical protein
VSPVGGKFKSASYGTSATYVTGITRISQGYNRIRDVGEYIKKGG